MTYNVSNYIILLMCTALKTFRDSAPGAYCAPIGPIDNDRFEKVALMNGFCSWG